ncbi:MAG: DUF58 domain-containing protein [Stappia sp.]|uniref:DUF58 domain-containing protein n=1 Tax=Stappia sp. TaxID=1870903 RepID=UPI000C530358|nr:DUF58 domain-containing protein [Stappia sp.]MAB00638.1 DUF58 domain-containing protein [Stappia sp.]MBM18708.1 DUF58 domain-containing protein [Stappia sp.]
MEGLGRLAASRLARAGSGETDGRDWPQIVAGGRTLADALPDLLVEARQVAMTTSAGWHGRRRAGAGENFWQFRPFIAGEPVKRIDWRRSARDNHLYVREREWEAAHTVWLWADLSPSMLFRSHLSDTVKRDRALVLLLALADLLAETGERVGLPGLRRAVADRHAAERIAATLAHVSDPVSLPEGRDIRRFSDVVLIGDLLDPLDETLAWMQKVAGSGARGHLVMVLDPVEETFPFSGRTEFRDPETGFRLTSGKAETWRTAYRDRLEAHRAAIGEVARRAGWTFLVHHTDRPAAEAMLVLHSRLSGVLLNDTGGAGR